jgi:rhamnosyl/mannosyltransferase
MGRDRPYVVTYHSDVVRQARILQLYKPLLRRFLRGASRILPTSENYVKRSPYLRAFAEKCTVVPLSVDADRFHHAKPLIEPATVPTLLFVGRHRYYKGVDDLLRALVDLPARLLIGGDGPMRGIWERLAADLQIDNRVRFLGNIEEEALPGLYASADIFVLPANSRAEAFGKVLLEAMAASLPCVTTELGTGTSFVVQHGRSGLVVAPGQPAALAEAIGRLLVDAELRREFGQCGRERVVREFTTETMTARVEAVYKSVLQEK